MLDLILAGADIYAPFNGYAQDVVSCGKGALHSSGRGSPYSQSYARGWGYWCG